MTTATHPFPLFGLGHCYTTPGAMEALVEAYGDRAGHEARALLRRHQFGDYGILSTDDREANTTARRSGARILSVYRLSSGVKLWILTEAVGDDLRRGSTCLLLPCEY